MTTDVRSLLGEDEAHDGIRMEQLSKKKKKQFHERIRKLHERRVAEPRLINPVKMPRYDRVYEQGVAWLEELAGSPQLEQGELNQWLVWGGVPEGGHIAAYREIIEDTFPK